MKTFIAILFFGALLGGGAVAFAQAGHEQACPLPCSGNITCQYRGEIACCKILTPGGPWTCYCSTDPNCV